MSEVAQDYRPTRIAKIVVGVIITLSMVGVVAFMRYIRMEQFGPRWFWASDMSPEPNVACGVIPGMVFVAAIGGSVLIVAGAKAVFAIDEGYNDE